MPVIDPIYSIEKDREVYHNHTDCTERNNIEAKNIRAGTGGKRLCDFWLEYGFGRFGGDNRNISSFVFNP
jgi:hypothetical protein